MTRAKKVLGGIAALALAMFLAPGIAQAADYSGNCAGVPSSVTGNVSITDTSCTLPNSVSATGYIHITADSISGSGKNLSSGTEIDINTTGNTTVGNLTASNYYIRVRADNISAGDVKTTTYGNILLKAQANLGVDDVEAAPGYNIDLKANAGGGNSLFTIGSTGSNAVSTITAHGSGNSPYVASTVVYVTNGTSSSTGGITVSDPAAISAVGGSGSRSGHIILNAQDGTLTIGSGTLSVDGTSGAGSIGLLASTIAFGNDAIVTASQPGAAGGTSHGIAMAAETVTFGGTNGLALHADGNGYSQYTTGFVQLMTQGAVAVTDSEDPTNLSIYGTTDAYKAGSVSYTGSGSAPLVVTGNGSNNGVWVYGYPVAFSGGTVLLQSTGVENHNINLLYYGTTSGLQALQFNGGNVTVDASGPNSGNGAGGIIYVVMDRMYRSNDGNATFKADGPASGTGIGGAITVYAGDAPAFNLGTAAGRYAFSAKGGSSAGNGGAIKLFPYAATMTIYGAGPSTTVLDVSVPGASGNGGEIELQPYGGLSFDGTASYLKANGGSSSGDGGKITIKTSNTAMTIGSGTSGAVDISASANASSGKGGTVDILDYSGLTVNTANIAVTATGSQNGGTVKLDAGWSTLSLNGNLSANGGSTSGAGGQILLSAGVLSLPAMTNTVLSVNGYGASSGGAIGITTRSTFSGDIVIGSGNQALSLSATSNGTGSGGSVSITSAKTLTVTSADIDVGAGASATNADGGDITFNGAVVAVTGTLSADAKGTGFPGTVSLTQTGSGVLDLDGLTISASADPTGDASGHDVTITNSGPDGISLDGTVINAKASVFGNGFGGSVHITSAAPVNLETASISARGAENGAGGVVVVTNATEFLVNKIIKVSAGEDVTNPNTFGGSITLNGATCQQWITGYLDESDNAVWPYSYWNCVNPGEPVSGDELPATIARDLPDDLKALLESTKATIYVQEDTDQFALFFGHVISPAAGFSFPEGVAETFDIAIFQNGLTPSQGYQTFNSTELTEVATHEFAHGLDYADSMPSGQQAFYSALAADVAYLDAAGGGNPCSMNNTAPFDGLIDFQTGQPFCTNGVLNNPQTAQFPLGIYTGLSNSNIAARSTPTLGPGTLAGSAGSEVYAQAFAYQYYAQTLTYPGGYFITTADGLFHKGFFSCAQVVAAQLAGTSFTAAYQCP